MKKLIALIILVLPVILAGIGIKLIRDSFFGIIHDPFHLLFVQFFIGLLMTIFGVWFIGGFILHRERQSKRASARFMKQSKDKKQS